MDCVFCKIVAGEIPGAKVYETDEVLAFLDINPVNPGHTLVVPKKHCENLLDADHECLEKIKQPHKIVEEFKGKKLLGQSYEPLYPIKTNEKAHYVIKR